MDKSDLMLTIDLKEKLKAHIGQIAFSTWFQALDIKETARDTWIIWTPNTFYKQKIEQQFQGAIRELEHKFSCHIDVQIKTKHSSTPSGSSTMDPIPPKPLVQTQAPLPTPVPSSFTAQSKFSFDNFIVGPNNTFAHAIASAVASSPGISYNPFFIYSPVGLGKTHIMQAIAMSIQQNHPHYKIMYLSTEKFTNELISALQNKTIAQFRTKYRTLDILLIDDIQFISGKERTQEEFFHTFNQLYNENKQIVLSSDHPPTEIPQLTDRLVSRFECGIIADIQPPDFETRVAILQKKAENIQMPVAKDILQYIATHFTSNIRELEGALLRIVALSTFQSTSITLDMAQKLFHPQQQPTMTRLTQELIQKVTCEHFHITIENLKSAKRNKMFVLPRQIAMYLCRELTEYSFSEIGSSFGGKDHTTIMHAYDKIKRKATTDEKLQYTLQELKEKIRG